MDDPRLFMILLVIFGSGAVVGCLLWIVIDAYFERRRKSDDQ